MRTVLRHSAILSLFGLLTLLRIPYGWGAVTHENFVSLHQREIVAWGEKKTGYEFANAPSFLCQRDSVETADDCSAISSVTEDDSLSLQPIVIEDGTKRLSGLTKFRVFIPPGAWRIHLNLYFAPIPHAYVVKLGDVPDEEILAEFNSQGGINRFNFDTQNRYTVAELHEPKYLTNGGSGYIQVLQTATKAPVSDDEGGWLYVWMLYPENIDTAYLIGVHYYVAVRPGPYIDWYNRMTAKGAWGADGDPMENWYEIINDPNISPDSKDVGGELGDHEYQVSVNDSKNLRLLLNTSPSADQTPVQEWLYLTIESPDSIGGDNLVVFLAGDREVPFSEITDFSSVNYDAFGSVRGQWPILEYFGMTTISPSELSEILGPKGTLTYTYAYSTQKVSTYQEFFEAFLNNRIHRNIVTIKLTD
jgi:hypothetical protein